MHQNFVRGLLITNFKKKNNINFFIKILLSSLVFIPICKPDFLSINKTMLKTKKIRKLHSKNNIILGWTFKSNFELIKYENYCDSYICEEKDETYI